MDIVPSKRKEEKMKKTIKKEGNEERPVLEVITNGLPDLSLMPSEELNVLCGLNRVIDEIIHQKSTCGRADESTSGTK